MRPKKLGLSTVLFGVFVAASALGGLAKIPSPVGSIALDSAPGYFLAAYFHPVLGGLVGAAGHLASAATGGFILGYTHLFIAGEMFFWCLAFGAVARIGDSQKWLLPASIIAVILNGVVGPYVLYLLPFVPVTYEMAVGIMTILTIASGINVGIAVLGVMVLTRSAARRNASE